MKLLQKEEEDPIIARAVEAIVAAYHIQVTLAERADAYGSVSLEAMAQASATSLEQALDGLGYSRARIRKLLKDYRIAWHSTRRHPGSVRWSAGGDFAQDHPANVRYLRARLRALAPTDPGRAPTASEQLRSHVRRREHTPEAGKVMDNVGAEVTRSGLPQPRARVRPLPTLPLTSETPPAPAPGPASAHPQSQARHRVRPPSRPIVDR